LKTSSIVLEVILVTTVVLEVARKAFKSTATDRYMLQYGSISTVVCSKIHYEAHRNQKETFFCAIFRLSFVQRYADRATHSENRHYNTKGRTFKSQKWFVTDKVKVKVRFT
jgi:ABC-type transporter MlaC component